METQTQLWADNVLNSAVDLETCLDEAALNDLDAKLGALIAAAARVRGQIEVMAGSQQPGLRLI